MKKKLKTLIIALIVMFCTSICYVQAASFVFTATADNSNIKPGDTITVEFSISNIDVEGSGINTISAKLEYDENVFDQVLSSSFAGENNWSITYNDEEGESEGNFLAVIIEDGVDTDQVIGKLKLRVKDGIENTQTQVKITDIVTNDGSQEIEGQDQTLTINVSKPVEPQDQNQNNNNNNNNGNNSSNNGNGGISSNSSNSSNKSSNNNSNKPLPSTGEELSAIIIITIGVTTIIGTITFICLKRMKEVK